MIERMDAKTILRMSSSCVIRPQESRYLFYNVRSDELHLVSPSGFYLVQLCNGMRSVAEIEALVADSLEEDLGFVQQQVRPFLDGMVLRGVLEVEDGN